MYNSDNCPAPQRPSQHIKDDYREEGRRNPLPSNGPITALIIGCVGGIIALAVPIIIVLVNAPLFSQAASASSKGGGVPYQIAIPLLGWQCLGTFVDLFIAFATGIVAGRFVVKSWPLGLVPGAVVGAVVYIGTSFVQSIPGYPDVVSSTTTSTTSVGFLPKASGFILFFLVWAAIGGLVSLGGTRLTIRKQPYSRSRVQE